MPRYGALYLWETHLVREGREVFITAIKLLFCCCFNPAFLYCDNRTINLICCSEVNLSIRNYVM